MKFSPLMAGVTVALGAPLPGRGALSSPWPLAHTSRMQNCPVPPEACSGPEAPVRAPWPAPPSLTCDLLGLTPPVSHPQEAWHLLAAPSLRHTRPHCGVHGPLRTPHP